MTEEYGKELKELYELSLNELIELREKLERTLWRVKYTISDKYYHAAQEEEKEAEK